jgi:hypothetical protein
LRSSEEEIPRPRRPLSGKSSSPENSKLVWEATDAKEEEEGVLVGRAALKKAGLRCPKDKATGKRARRSVRQRRFILLAAGGKVC